MSVMARKLLQFSLDSPFLSQPIRHGHWMRGKPPHLASSLKDRLNEMKKEAGERHFINIGFKPTKLLRRSTISEWMTDMRNHRKDLELEKQSRHQKLSVDMDKVEEIWLKTSAPQHIYTIAKHYGVYDDLFGDGYFLPILPLNITYNYGDQNTVNVHRGNVIKPGEASTKPTVSYDSNPESLWTLLMTCPDFNLSNPENEYCHWFIGNIPGNEVEKGQEIIDYLRPIPPRGIGYGRYIFVLYKQAEPIDYSEYKKEGLCTNLEERDWNTLKFYQKYQDNLTPAGLAFFQADWDQSLQEFYYNVLNMKQPEFEYDFPPQYLAPQKWFPKKMPFNLYLDKYRDVKVTNKRYLLRKLKDTDPFKPPVKPFKYPNTHLKPQGLPSWLSVEMKKDRLGWGRITCLNEE